MRKFLILNESSMCRNAFPLAGTLLLKLDGRYPTTSEPPSHNKPGSSSSLRSFQPQTYVSCIADFTFATHSSFSSIVQRRVAQAGVPFQKCTQQVLGVRKRLESGFPDRNWSLTTIIMDLVGVNPRTLRQSRTVLIDISVCAGLALVNQLGS